MHELGQWHDFMQHSVNSVSYADAVLERLNVNVA